MPVSPSSPQNFFPNPESPAWPHSGPRQRSRLATASLGLRLSSLRSAFSPIPLRSSASAPPPTRNPGYPTEAPAHRFAWLCSLSTSAPGDLGDSTKLSSPPTTRLRLLVRLLVRLLFGRMTSGRSRRTLIPFPAVGVSILTDQEAGSGFWAGRPCSVGTGQ